VFAPGRERNEKGYILYPRDTKYRREHFAPECVHHPAKYNCFHLEDVVEWVSEPGETIMDIMGGSGTTMLATLKGRKVVLIEEAAIFHYFQTLSVPLFLARGVPPENIMLLHGACQDYLPLPVDHIIFSPPYMGVMKKSSSKSESSVKLHSSYGYSKEDNREGWDDYFGDTDKNLARMNNVVFNLEMKKIYQGCFDSLRPGGTMTVITQDIMRGGVRDELTTETLNRCVQMGFEFVEWFDRYIMGTAMKSAMRARGVKVIDNESTIIVRRPL
jgi:DNA modification methylase